MGQICCRWRAVTESPLPSIEAEGRGKRPFGDAAAVVPPKGGSSRWDMSSSSLPDDIALKIASFLEAPDVCSLGSCSRAWRALCASDCIWIALFKKRWPSLALAADGSSEAPSTSEPQIRGTEPLSSPTQGWKSFYISKHEEKASCVSSVVKFVEQCSENGSLEVGNYLKAIADLCSIKLGFKDVQLFLLARKQGVLLNLIGLHYSMFWLRILPDEMTEALHSCKVTERQVCVSWFKLGRWFYGFRMSDENRSRKVSLGELAMNKEGEVLSVLNRGAVYEVLRVQITPITASTAQA